MSIKPYAGQVTTFWQRVQPHLRLLLFAVGLLWLIEFVDLLLPGTPLDRFGIHPRSVLGLGNVFLAPFLHAGFGHLLANTVPFIILGLLVLLQRGTQGFGAVVAISALVSGLGVWLFGGAHTIHLGASGVIFGFFGFLLGSAWHERSARALVVALLVVVFYGGMIWGVLPGQQGISWLAHLFGLIGGLLAAWLLRDQPTA
jgi:membrane associated rhomboid family serine protease